MREKKKKKTHKIPPSYRRTIFFTLPQSGKKESKYHKSVKFRKISKTMERGMVPTHMRSFVQKKFLDDMIGCTGTITCHCIWVRLPKMYHICHLTS